MDCYEITGRMERLLRGKSPDAFEIFLESGRALSLEVNEGKVESFTSSTPAGLSIRVLKDGGMGFSFTSSLDEASLLKTVENAFVAARYQTPDEMYGFPLPEEYPSAPFLFDPELAEIPLQEKVGRALELERLARGEDPRIVRVRKATYGESSAEVLIRNSLGVSGSCRTTSASCSVSVVAEENGESRLGWDFAFARGFGGVSLPGIAASAARRATGLLGAREVETMRSPAVLDNYVATEFLEIVASSLVAENVQKGKSMLADRMGEVVFSPLLSVVDDGLHPEGAASFPFDGEGVPSRRTVAVGRGVLKSFLYDTFRGRRGGVASTGNAARDGFRSPPRNGISNFFIENGESTEAVLLAGIRKGVFLTEVMGMHTANPVSGDFSVGAAGFLVENGMVGGPFKGAVSGNVLELFRNVDAVGDNLRFYGSVGAPSLRITALDVSGR